MTMFLSIGMVFTFLLVAYTIVRWGNVRLTGSTPVGLFTFIAILFASGLDVGLIMFPLTEFPVYADLVASPEYGFTNPLAIEFGFWGFLIWSFYFLTTFYFCLIEPKVKFFEIKIVKLINNFVIVTTCALTAHLFLINLPWYLPALGDGSTVGSIFYGIVFVSIVLATLSSTHIRYVRILSLASVAMFAVLIAVMWVSSGLGILGMVESLGLVGGYFTNLPKFALPFNAYHEFYLFWWFSWSIMIGQFVSRFVGGLKTYQVLVSMLVIPSIPLAIWFSVLYKFHVDAISIVQFNIAMAVVGTVFVVNSLDSLIRLYTDNMGYTYGRLGAFKYIVGNVVALSGLGLLFTYGYLTPETVGSIVIAIFFVCFFYILAKKRSKVASIK